MAELVARLGRGLIAVLLPLLLAEATIKLFPNPMSESPEGQFWVYDADLGWAHVPSSEGVFQSRHFGYHGVCTFDEHGFRGTGAPAPSGKFKKILLLGDSTTATQEVDDQETWAAIVEREFREAGKPVKVYNAGVRGYGPDQELLQLRRLLPLINPDLVLYLASDNDVEDLVTIKNRHRLYSKPAFFYEDGELKPVNSPAQKYDLEYFAYISCEKGPCRVISGQARAGGLFAWLRDHSFFYKYVEDFYYVKFGPASSYEQRFDTAYSDRLFPIVLAEEKKLFKNFYMTSFTENGGPVRGGYDHSWEMAKRAGVAFLDIRPSFSMTERYIYPIDGHWNQKGNRVAGEAIYSLLKDKL